MGEGSREREMEREPTACDHQGVVYAAQPAQAVPEGGTVDVGVEDLWRFLSFVLFLWEALLKSSWSNAL